MEYLQILRSVEGSQEQIQWLNDLACGMQFLLKLETHVKEVDLTSFTDSH